MSKFLTTPLQTLYNILSLFLHLKAVIPEYAIIKIHICIIKFMLNISKLLCYIKIHNNCSTHKCPDEIIHKVILEVQIHSNLNIYGSDTLKQT